jgi:hypothetical protein
MQQGFRNRLHFMCIDPHKSGADNNMVPVSKCAKVLRSILLEQHELLGYFAYLRLGSIISSTISRGWHGRLIQTPVCAHPLLR